MARTLVPIRDVPAGHGAELVGFSWAGPAHFELGLGLKFGPDNKSGLDSV